MMIVVQIWLIIFINRDILLRLQAIIIYFFVVLEVILIFFGKRLVDLKIDYFLWKSAPSS